MMFALAYNPCITSPKSCVRGSEDSNNGDTALCSTTTVFSVPTWAAYKVLVAVVVSHVSVDPRIGTSSADMGMERVV